jgi:hypothetical protein
MIRCLVLVQDVRHVHSVAKQIAAHLSSHAPASLNGTERAFLETAIDEMGGEAHVLQPVAGLVGQHHGLLLTSERRLAESTYSRDQGVRALVASPTLAMGMNLPAEAVIIAGDDRFDSGTNRMQQLAAHELLNSAGRAGRAGSCPQGIVIVVPGKLVGVDWGEGTVGHRWMELQAAFSKSDQCLAIGDPIQLFLDQLGGEGIAEGQEAEIQYFLFRLPSSDSDKEIGELLRRSLGAYHARRTGREAAYDVLVENATRHRSELVAQAPTDWHRTLGCSTGLSPNLIATLDASVAGLDPLPENVFGWLEWWIRWLIANPELARTLHRAGDKAAPFDALLGESEGLARLHALLVDWMQGRTLRDLEIRLGTAQNKLGACQKARQFVLRVVPDVSFGARLLGRVFRLSREPDTGVPLELECLSRCVALGLESPEEAAVSSVTGRERLGAKRLLAEISTNLPRPPQEEDFESVRSRVRIALQRRTRDP